MDKKELTVKFLEVVEYLLRHGEMMKGLWYLQNSPAFIEEESKVNTRLGEVLTQLSGLKDFQNHGTVGGKFNAGFHVPPNINEVVSFQLLKKHIMEKSLATLVDVGCFSGWIGKELSTLGVEVWGIDINPVVIQLAAFHATGSLAIFEFLPVQKLGYMHPKQFDGAILFDVLEHVFDPELALKNVKMAVKDGGWVFINLPHPKGENESKDTCKFHEHEHLYSFSQKEIERLMGKEKNFNLEVITNEANQINWFINYQI